MWLKIRIFFWGFGHWGKRHKPWYVYPQYGLITCLCGNTFQK